MVKKVFEVSLEDKQGRWLESKTPPRVQGRRTHEVVSQSAQSMGTVTLQCT